MGFRILVSNPGKFKNKIKVYFQVPALVENPFEKLKVLTYEGEQLPRHVAKFLLRHSVHLEQLQLSLDTLSLEIICKSTSIFNPALK
jgi:hypothetical protein